MTLEQASYEIVGVFNHSGIFENDHILYWELSFFFLKNWSVEAVLMMENNIDFL